MEDTLTTHIRNQVLIKPTTFNEELKYNNRIFNHRQEYYKITGYIDDFLKGKNINRYLVLPGIRDAGKSTILFQIYNYLKTEKNIDTKNILYLSCDNLKRICNNTLYEGITCYLDTFHQSIPETVKEPVFLLIDEAHYDPDWSLTGKIIFDSNRNIFMIFSGSSALELTYNADSARRLLRIPVTPLNYPQHLKLKYGDFNNTISKSVHNLIFDGDVNNINRMESEILDIYLGFDNFNANELDNFLKFGGFPSYPHQSPHEIMQKIVDTTNRIVTVDMKNIEGLNANTHELAFNIIYFLAFKNPGEVSKGSMANIFDSNKTTMNKIIDTLEKTQLIFHADAFTSSPKRSTKPKKYYFATSSIKHSLSMNLGNASLEDKNAYMGKLFENYVASCFFNLEKRSNVIYRTYYDAGKKQKKNVDFIVQRGMDRPVPVEVSYGNKDKIQIKDAVKRYKADYGIIISNTTSKVKKEDNIIYLPVEVFSFL